MLSIIIVGYKPEKKKLNKVLKIIGKNIKVIFINNSENYNLKNIKFSKNTVVLNSKNNGNGAGINLGIKNCKTKYALYLDIDVLFKKNFIKNFINFAKKNKDFAILVPNHGNLNSKKKKIEKYEGEASIMLFNLSKLEKIGFFDEKYFLYFEEQDLFFKCKKNNLKTFFIPSINIKHLRASSVSQNIENIHYLRAWHYMWSMFYFYKKNYSFIDAIKKI
ncbi:MAG: glycosyltransferase, partial [Pelagibacterales bacterium]|nr:glycosyltransferase [Pelagibacterales bacterium]